MDNLRIRMASRDDVGTIRHIAEKIWPEAYGKILSSGQIRYMLGLMYSEDALLGQMENEHVFLLLENTEQSFGFASFHQVDNEIFRLNKLYLDISLHGLGWGKTMLEDVVTRAREKGGRVLELNVNKYNPAKRFYEGRGFIVFREEVIEIGGGFVMDDFVMRRTI